MSKLSGAFSRFFKEIREEMLPDQEQLLLKLKQLCCRCPAGAQQVVEPTPGPAIRESIESCRKEYFGLLMQAFVGKAGNEETDRLYHLWNRCEQCSRYHPGEGDRFILDCNRPGLRK